MASHRLLPGIVSGSRTRRLLCVLLMLSLFQPGCVRRRMTIRSNPAGATVYVDDQEIGTTPVSTEFTYYGTRKIQLIKDGYETLTVKQAFFPPWYQFPVIEFFSENLSLWEHRDDHLLDFQLEPQQILPADRLLERAQELRSNASQGYSVVLPTVTPLPQAFDSPMSSDADSSGTPPAVLPPLNPGYGSR